MTAKLKALGAKLGPLLLKVQSEIVLVGGALIFAGQIAASQLPPGTARDTLRYVLPILVTVVQRARSVPLAFVEQAIARLLAKRDG